VLSFKEKPDITTAEKYVESGKYFWNSGLFAYKTDFFISQMSEYSKEIYSLLLAGSTKLLKRRVINAVKIYNPTTALKKAYALCPSISIDYAIMEKTPKIKMLKASFDWNDVGSWDVIADLNKSALKNITEIETRRTILYTRIFRFPYAA